MAGNKQEHTFSVYITLTYTGEKVKNKVIRREVANRLLPFKVEENDAEITSIAVNKMPKKRQDVTVDVNDDAELLEEEDDL